MRFDFKKERYGPGYYSHMPKEQLSYHIANKKRIYIVGNEIKRSIEGAPASIVIDEFGKFSVESYFPKSGKIKITKERLESIILEIIDFLGTSLDYGYLIPEEPEDGDQKD